MASLLCTETTNACFDDLDSDQTHDETTNQNLGFGNDRSEPLIGWPLLSEECFCLLVEKERGHLPKDDYLKRVRSGDMDLGAVRREAMDWILKVCLISFLNGFIASYPKKTNGFIVFTFAVSQMGVRPLADFLLFLNWVFVLWLIF